MILTILDRNGQVVLSQKATPDITALPSLNIAIRQQHGDNSISLSAYTLPGVLLWAGIIQFSEPYMVRTENAMPILQVTLLFSSSAYLPHQQFAQNFQVHLQSGANFSINREEGITHIVLLQFSAFPFAGLPQIGCIQLLQAWLDMASSLPRDEMFSVGSESSLSNLCRQVINPDYSKALLLAYLHLKVQEIILAICDLVSSGSPNTIASEREQAGLQRVVQAIRNEPEKNHAIIDLAKAAGLNRSSLQASFKAHYGMTLRSFVLSCRMEAALKLITETDLLFKEIAYRLGYSDPDNFYSAFKQYYGKRAGDLRRERNNRDEIK